MYGINKAYDIYTLRLQLIECEESIIKQSKFDGYLVNFEKEDKVCDLLETRCDILNQMFQIHSTGNEINRFEYVNEQLFIMTQDFNDWHQHLQQRMSAIHGLNGEPFNLETTLNYYHEYDNPKFIQWKKTRSMDLDGMKCCASTAYTMTTRTHLPPSVRMKNYAIWMTVNPGKKAC